MPPPQPRAPPALPDELVEEILLRVPPADPASLVRAALACRRWRGLVAGPTFRRRRLELHGATPPMLGFVCDGKWDGDRDGERFARFVPASSFLPPRADQRGRRSFDARHGRFLLHGSKYEDFIVWDPITDHLLELPRPPDSLGNRSMKATVLCAATGACDHLDCHRGPFIVVLVGTNNEYEEVDVYNDYIEDGLDEKDYHDIMFGGFRVVPKDMFACVYSSESGHWERPLRMTIQEWAPQVLEMLMGVVVQASVRSS
ncbi:hypothetical protein BAE44_0026439 [Dichanthelium oligosanthes]|uniref:F-box domain-containing protein n=1 Tax=Dichanthelium oligosanthes TaxID=888268 RepID=A0A1E5UI28_9POAL|nr:hypothetical protein BAE44_0026439 [Dichanthelium oligosanthes]